MYTLKIVGSVQGMLHSTEQILFYIVCLFSTFPLDMEQFYALLLIAVCVYVLV